LIGHLFSQGKENMTTTALKIGFVGLGIMGAPMAGHLIKAAISFSSTHAASSMPRSPQVGRRFAHMPKVWPSVPTSSS
jgi:hypothetical protein